MSEKPPEYKLIPDVIMALDSLHCYLEKKSLSENIPQYIFEKISKYDDGKQLEITKRIIQFIKTEKLSGSKFTWPSIKSINTFLGGGKSDSKVDDSAVVFEKNDMPSKKNYIFAEKIVKKSKHVLIIPATKKHPAYLINKKTNTVSIIDEKDTVITLVEMPSVPLYTLPKKAVTHLDLNESLDVTMKCFENNNDVIKYFKKHPHSQILILSK